MREYNSFLISFSYCSLFLINALFTFKKREKNNNIHSSLASNTSFIGSQPLRHHYSPVGRLNHWRLQPHTVIAESLLKMVTLQNLV